MKLRWGILGAARINRSVVPPLQASERNELVAVAARDRERAEEEARRWGIPRAYAGYEALLADPAIDVVYVPLPNALHAEWTIRAVRAGKHVLCEKPLALDVGEVDAVTAAGREARVVVAEAFMYRHHPQTLRVRELVAGGAVGTPRLVRGAFTFTLTRENDPRVQIAQGGGSLWDVGCYPLGYARFVLGEEPVEAFGWHTLGPTGVDVGFSGQLRFPSGAFLAFDSGFAVPLRASIEVVGSEGVLSVPHPFKPGRGEHLLLARGEHVETIEVAGEETYRGEIEDMADAVLLGRPPRVSLADSRANVAALVALGRAAREGRPVAVR
jgi:D-xylose 1-dehydrogenase (NADP+, D-xylono-1,5-lactone-forming)